jgi:multiple sugar transport system permease protein
VTATAVGSPTRTRSQRAGRATRRRQNWGWVFIAPFAVLFLVFFAAPLIYAGVLSTWAPSVLLGDRFVGLDNYVRAFTDPAFLEGLGRVALFVLVMIPLQMVVAIAAALVLDSLTTRLSRFSRLAMFVPYSIPAVIGVLMWGFLYSPSFGPAAQLANLVGLPSPDLLSADAIFGSLTNIVTWQWAGYYMVIVYAALQSINPEIYEAAVLDGATRRQIALRIKLPMVSSSIVLILVFAIIGTLQFFTEPQVMSNVAPSAVSPSYTPNLYAYNTAFQYGDFNYASALSFALAIVVFAGSYLFMYLTRKRSGLQ